MQKYLFLFIPVDFYLFLFGIMQYWLFGLPQMSYISDYISVMLSTEDGMAPESENVEPGLTLFCLD